MLVIPESFHPCALGFIEWFAAVFLPHPMTIHRLLFYQCRFWTKGKLSKIAIPNPSKRLLHCGIAAVVAGITTSHVRAG